MATIEQIKELRDRTGAGVNAVREALEVSKGNIDEAVKYLRQKGVAKAEKRKDRTAANGILGTYVHPNSKVVVVVEVNTETDFAAKSEDMVKFAQDLALHIAAKNPKYINPSTVDEKELQKEKDVYEKELEGKPEDVKAKIMEGKISKFYEDVVLVKQTLFTDENKTVEDYLNEIIAKIGEKIEIKQFSIFKVSEPVCANIIVLDENSSEE